MGSKRVNVKAILADPDLRRTLMVSTIQATQAREGIETTPEQADRAYYLVSEAEKVSCFDLVGFKAGGSRPTDDRHPQFVRSLRMREGCRTRYDVARRDFSVIEGAPLAYRNLSLLGPLFRAHSCLSPGWADIQGGMNATESDRFLRYRWEPSPDSLRRWTTYSKGGAFSRFYSDILRVIDWTDDGHQYKAVVENKYGSASRFVKSEDYYGRPGLTWTEMTNKGLNVRRLPAGAIFNCKGPCAFPNRLADEAYLLAIMNSSVAQALLGCLTSRSYGSTYVARLPIPRPSLETMDYMGKLAEAIFAAKASWDTGNELSSRFTLPWLLFNQPGIENIAGRLDALLSLERKEEERVRATYHALDRRAYEIYGVAEHSRGAIENGLGDRRRADKPASVEVLWLFMEGKSADQKRMEHIWRLLSYAVKRVLEADDDGIVPFNAVNGEPRLVERVRHELGKLFPDRDASQVEVEIVNELNQAVKGYRRCASLDAWLDNAFFEYHCGLYKNRPIFWHIASAQGSARFAFGALVHYHRFDKNRLAKLRATYLRDAIEEFRREAGLADKAGATAARLEWQAKLEEAQALDLMLQAIQEGHREGIEGGERDYRILTPWKTSEERPKGWDPDLDDGVKVNIEPLQKAGVLRVVKVI